jgi:hypothetical protein
MLKTIIAQYSPYSDTTKAGAVLQTNQKKPDTNRLARLVYVIIYRNAIYLFSDGNGGTCARGEDMRGYARICEDMRMSVE